MSNGAPPLRTFPARPDWLEAGEYKHDYQALLTRAWALVDGGDVESARNIIRALFLDDLFFMVYFGLGRRDIHSHETPWLLRICREIEDGPQTDTVDLWARGHYKSTIITQARSLQEVLRSGGELTVGIFSHTRPIAKSFLRPIKTALERNRLLQWAFPDVIWEDPRREAPVWSMDDGLALKRRAESNTQTFEAWGLIDGMPIGKHFDLRVYDDLITEDVARSPDLSRKVDKAFRLSDNLGTKGGRLRVIGTIYSHADLYCQLIAEAEAGTYQWHVRKRPWYRLDAHGEREPVLLSWQEIREKKSRMGPYVWATQMELEPAVDETKAFRAEWIRYYGELPETLDTYIIVDPATSKRIGSDYTAMVVIGIDSTGLRFLLDLVRDRLDLKERWEALAEMWKRWGPCRVVAYEQYGMQADIAYIQEKQQQTGLYFHVEPVGGRTAKVDRILRLVPVFSEYRFMLPRAIYYRGRNLISEFINEEYLTFPFSAHDDMLDAISRIEDPQLAPYIRQRRPNLDKYAHRKNRPMKVHSAAWMGV